MIARVRRNAPMGGAVAAQIIQRAVRHFNAPRPTRPGGGLAMRNPLRPMLRGSKLVVKKVKTGVVRPRRIKSVIGQLSQSAYRLGARVNPQVRALKRVGAPNISVNQRVYQLNVAAGFQQSLSFFHWSIPEVETIIATVPQATTTGPTRCVLESAQNQITFTNSSTASAEVEIYDLVLKKDLLVAPNFTVNGQTYSPQAVPSSYWNVGANASEGATGTQSPPASHIIGSSPFDSLLFKDYFKVHKRTSVMLPQGATHRHSVLIKPSRLINQFELPGNSTGAFGMRGLTVFTMLVAKGVPISDTASTVPTTANVLLDCIQGIRYKWTWVADTSSTGYYQDTLTSPVTADTALLNIGSGTFTTASVQ